MPLPSFTARGVTHLFLQMVSRRKQAAKERLAKTGSASVEKFAAAATPLAAHRLRDPAAHAALHAAGHHQDPAGQHLLAEICGNGKYH